MNIDITAYLVIDPNPPFIKTIANFSTFEYVRLATITLSLQDRLMTPLLNQIVLYAEKTVVDKSLARCTCQSVICLKTLGKMAHTTAAHLLAAELPQAEAC